MSGLKRSAVVFLLLFAVIASAQTAQDNLKKGRALVGQGKFAPALKLVEKAMTEPGNDLETTLELLELQGVCNAALKKPGPAKAAFGKLVSLSPGYEMNRRGPPPAVKAFADAKASAEPLVIVPAAPDMSTGKISEIALEVKSDSHKYAKTVVFNYRVGGGKWKFRAVPVTNGRVASKVDAPEKVEWYATVLGANETEILRIRNADSPITHTYQAPAPREKAVAQDTPRRSEERSLTPEEKPASDIEVLDSGKKRARWVTPISVTLIGAGAVAGGVGTYFGIQSAGARSRFAAATMGADPVVVGFTRRDAQGLDSQARSGGLIANSLWVAAGALVLTGVGLMVFGPEESAR
jgi:hypothetical protein